MIIYVMSDSFFMPSLEHKESVHTCSCRSENKFTSKELSWIMRSRQGLDILLILPQQIHMAIDGNVMQCVIFP